MGKSVLIFFFFWCSKCKFQCSGLEIVFTSVDFLSSVLITGSRKIFWFSWSWCWCHRKLRCESILESQGMSLARMIMMVITSLEEILLQGIFFVANSKILLHTVSFSSSHVQHNWIQQKTWSQSHDWCSEGRGWLYAVNLLKNVNEQKKKCLKFIILNWCYFLEWHCLTSVMSSIKK